MKKIISVMLLIITVLSFAGCGNGKVGKIIKEDDKEIYENNRYGFKFELPSEWKDKYEITEAGGTAEGDKDVLKFQVEFKDKDFYKKEPEDRKIYLRIFVSNRNEIERLAKKEEKDIDTYMESNEFEKYLGKDDESVYSVQFKEEKDMTLDKVKEMFSIIEK